MAAVRTGWWTRNTLPWVKRSASFGLSVTPSLGIGAAAGTPAGAVGLAVSPSVGMVGAGHHTAGFGLAVSIGLGMAAAGKSVADFGISVTPQLGASAGNRTPASVGLVVVPSLGMEIAAVNPGTPFSFGLSVTPSLGMAAAERYAAAFGLAVTPELAIGTGAMPASVGLAVTPALGMDGGSRNPASFGLSVTPSLGMAAAERYAAAFGLAVTPALGVAGEARYPGGVGLSVTPSMGMAAKATMTYSSFPSVPSGTINVALNSGAGSAQASSNTLQEANCTASNATYRSAAVLPESMATDLFWVEVTVGALSAAAGDRNTGAGAFSADGTVGVVTLWPASSNTATIYSWKSGTLTQQASLGSQAANTGAKIRLVPSVSAGVVTWTAWLDGVPTALTWPDTGHLIDLPGRHPAAGFRRAYNFGQYPSRGISALTAADI